MRSPEKTTRFTPGFARDERQAFGQCAHREDLADPRVHPWGLVPPTLIPEFARSRLRLRFRRKEGTRFWGRTWQGSPPECRFVASFIRVDLASY